MTMKMSEAMRTRVRALARLVPVAVISGRPVAEVARMVAGDTITDAAREAARAFLASFGAAPTGPNAPESLFKLGASLGALGQTSEGCVTLSEVSVRFPDSSFVAQAQAQRDALGCS